MASTQHTCTGCVPIDSSILETYIALQNAIASSQSAASTASDAATAANGAATAANNAALSANAAAAAANAAGITQAEASVDANTGVPSVDVSLVNKKLTLAFHNVKGEKGDRGDGAVPIVNDLTTGGTDAALSAEMGKTLNNTKQANLVSGTNIKTVNGESLLGSGNIVAGDPNAVKYTEQTLTDAQKTQARTNIGAGTGTYTKAAAGIPKTDLESGVQASLDLADTAIQARPSGEVDPTITPAEYATQEELSQLDQKRPIFSEGLDLLVLPNDGNGYITSSGTRNTNGNFRTIFIGRNILSSDIVVDGNADFVHFFDSTKTWISCFKSWNDTGFVRIKSTDIPAACAYVALCWDARVTQSLSVYDFRRFVETQKETPFAALFRSGSNRFYSTANTVATSWIMPTYGAQYIIVKIGFSAGAGNKFKVIAAKYISKSNVATVNVAMDASETLYGSSVIIPVANYAGFAFSLNIVNDADETQPFTMASFSAGDVTVERVFQVNVAAGAKKTYTGQPMALDLFSVEMLGSVSSLGWHQSGVFYGKYALFFSERTMLATLVDTDNLTIIGTFPVAYGTYDAPHCNTASLGKDFGGETSIMPLIYVSQWEGDERACFVYDMTYSEGLYSLSLVQKINFAGVSSSILGAGPVDFAVDTDAGELIALAYKTAQDVQRGTALMIAKMSIPDASVSEVTVADADITAHFETENIAVRQDAFYRCGKIYIAAGYGNSELAATVTAISVKDGSILSRLETSQFVYGEPEMLDVFGNEIVFSVGGDIIYKILF